MTELQIFDPVQCCTTGVCGPTVDPALAQFAADLRWLQEQGVRVQRFNLGQNPAAFTTQPLVRAELERIGESALPMVLVNGKTVSTGRHPSRRELASWCAVVDIPRMPRLPSAPIGSP